MLCIVTAFMGMGGDEAKSNRDGDITDGDRVGRKVVPMQL